jgi:cyclopropane fatty-acyl-phospholipid synthase-like methyltransferase
MTALRQKIFSRLYRRAPSAESLPWHRDEPLPLLRRVVERRPPGRALDLGCGQGVDAVYLAQRGWSVVGVDFVSGALDLARARARDAGVAVELRECDVLDYDSTEGFDLVLDSGCLHHLPGARLAAYRDRLERWILSGGDYVLAHFCRRCRLDLLAGPRRATREQVRGWFRGFELVAYEQTTYDLSFPLGTMLAGVYWFRPDSSPSPRFTS